MRKIEFSRVVERVLVENLVGSIRLWDGTVLGVPEDARPDISAVPGSKEKIYQFITNDENKSITAKQVEKFTIDRTVSQTPLTEFEELVLQIINGETEGNVYFKNQVAHTSKLIGGIVGDKYYLVADKKAVFYNDDFSKFEENEKPLQ